MVSRQLPESRERISRRQRARDRIGNSQLLQYLVIRHDGRACGYGAVSTGDGVADGFEHGGGRGRGGHPPAQCGRLSHGMPVLDEVLAHDPNEVPIELRPERPYISYNRFSASDIVLFAHH